MRAFVVKELTRHENITLSHDAPEPRVKADEVLIDVYSAGLNFFDILQTQGKYQNKPPLPFVLGTEFAGRISKNSPIPKGCSLKPGDRVFGAGQGTYADKMVAHVGSVLPLPDELTFDQGASLYITWPTSYEALVGRASIKAGDWVLVLAAAGGVGIAAVQLAKVFGAKVIAAAGTSQKLEVAKRHGGADYTVDYTKAGWQKEVLQITSGKGVDIIYDPVGMIQDSLKCIAWKGRAVVIGFAGGTIEKVPTNLVLLKNVSVVGLHWGAYRTHESSRIPQVWQEVLDLFKSRRVKPVIYTEVYPLERLSEGLAALEHRKTWGKAVIKIREEESTRSSTGAKL